MTEKRSSFTGKIGFVLAAAGSAVGLGNIWRFPYLAAKCGGGIFLLVYLILAVTFGFALMVGEIALGRKTGLSAIGAFNKLNKKYSFIGVIAAVIPALILPYYSVIGGWVTKYFTVFVTGGMSQAASDDFFVNFVYSKENFMEPVGWFLLFIALTAVVVLFGVEKGVEKVSKFMMPVLVVLTVFIAVYAMFMPGAMEGVKYYLKPDFSRFSITTVLAAMGQLFYSMSLAMGIMITYGSYMKKDVNIEKSVRQIEIFDTGIAFFAGLMIIPAVFAFDKDSLGKGPGLMFITLPKVFAEMPGGTVIGAVFFLLVFFAALTSSISLMETIVSIIRDKLGWNRKVVCLIVFAFCIALGLPSCFGFNIWENFSIKSEGGDQTILDMFDFVSNSILMPIVALFTCIFIGYIIKPKTLIEEVEITGPFKAKKLFTVVIKYIAPIFIVMILAFAVVEKLAEMKIININIFG